MRRRRTATVAALVAAALAGGLVAGAVRGTTAVAVAGSPPPITTATVQRTNLATSVLTEGTLGYAPSDPVVNQLAGTYTALAAIGTTVGPGQVLYRVDNLPVVLMTGGVPAWRPFGPGMSDGPDVTELQAGLIALDDAVGLLTTPNGHFDTPTADAVERWQRAQGLNPDGQIALGQVVFLPGPVLVGAGTQSPGDAATPGDVPYAVTTTTRVVTVPLNPDLPAVTVGERVSIVLPTNSATPGTVSAVGPTTSSTGGQSSGTSGTSSQSAVTATVTPSRPDATGTGAGVPVQVALTGQTATHVLVVPIAALLALAGGGYGLEMVSPSGVHHLVGVTTGLFTGTRVAVTGAGVRPGDKVVVAQ